MRRILVICLFFGGILDSLGTDRVEIVGSAFGYHRGESEPSTVLFLKTTAEMGGNILTVECNPCKISDESWGVELAAWNGEEFRSMLATTGDYSGDRIEVGNLRHWVGRKSLKNSRLIGSQGDFFGCGLLLLPSFVEIGDTGRTIVDWVTGAVPPEDLLGVSVTREPGRLRLEFPSSTHEVRFDSSRGIIIFPEYWKAEYFSSGTSGRLIVETLWGSPESASLFDGVFEIPTEYERTYKVIDRDGNEKEISRVHFVAEEFSIVKGTVDLPGWFDLFPENAPWEEPFLIEEYIE